MLADIEPSHLVELRAYYSLEPFGDDWPQAARIEAAIRNAMGGQSVNPADLIPNDDNRTPGEIDDANLKSVWQAKLGF